MVVVEVDFIVFDLYNEVDFFLFVFFFISFLDVCDEFVFGKYWIGKVSLIVFDICWVVIVK